MDVIFLYLLTYKVIKKWFTQHGGTPRKIGETCFHFHNIVGMGSQTF